MLARCGQETTPYKQQQHSNLRHIARCDRPSAPGRTKHWVTGDPEARHEMEYDGIMNVTPSSLVLPLISSRLPP